MTNRATLIACPSRAISASPKSTWAKPGRWISGTKTSARVRLQAEMAAVTTVFPPV
jgi:hypothetical protein